ncbi:ABC transporter substrate-binding protein [Pseudooceanicola onchidii]|uniref:ABC transporter substrate-binding protein n=1 Tax=Pseudooceanicola onchidii TaxID=2562279 RepID=UPI0010AB119A|nr:CmpA/NrtA family ABC transporter substrate-binding protein [Pseudooceanicola onchidii]
MSDVLTAGFLPLTDAAPLIVAREMGFAAEEGLELSLIKATSWSSLRDYLLLGKLDAAQMLAPVPVAHALGLGALGGMDVIAALNLSGNVVSVSKAIAAEMQAAGYGFDFTDAAAAGRALIALGRPLRIAVPFPFSMHAELLYYWLDTLGLAAPQSLSVRTVPPPLMAEAMADGEVDAVCVGEPWGSLAVENGDGVMLLPTSAIRQSAIEKVLAVRSGWAEDNPDLTRKALRALWRAASWLDQPEKREVAAEIMARPDYLGLPVDLVERGLRGNFTISPQGDLRAAPGFLTFASGAAGFPWRSQAAWIGMRIAARTGLDQAEAMAAARAVFRTDIYRDHLRGVSADLPSASQKLEGGLDHATEVASESGRVILPPDRFFDGTVFDPD